jgi:FkbM family methyltransferase
MRPGLRHPDPSYVWRPDQLGRRLYRSWRGLDRPVVTLPWGAKLEVDATELLGAGIARMSTYELTVSETMWRLTDGDDLALDVGANVGYYSALMAHRARRVVAFEPHPGLAACLRRNAARWPSRWVEVEERAASDETGLARLTEPEGFAGNAGAATLHPEDDSAATSFEVETVRLDEVVGEEAVGILKMDIEGHELAALDGLGEALADGRVRDVFFEDYEALPTPVSSRLEGFGFEVFSLQQRFRRVDLGSTSGPSPRWYAPTYLATLDPQRATRRMRSDGWRCLRPRRRSAFARSPGATR